MPTVWKIFVLALALALGSCTNQGEAEETAAVAISTPAPARVANTSRPQAVPIAQRPIGWDEYWYAGLAEVNSYTVKQERYGEMREGNAVLVFVTEPFFPKAQVKDDGLPAREESISIFKLNRIERFTTGIYDYSLMLSVFTPVDEEQYPYTLKSTFSAQDWCGQVWQQTNRRNDKFMIETRSYFQAEGDTRAALDAPYLEDELLNRMRLNIATVPTGKLTLIPAAKFTRLRHVDTEAQVAEVSLVHNPDTYATELVIDYPQLERKVIYTFNSKFPYRLEGWTEEYKGQLLSEARLQKSMKTAYWGQNAERFAYLRDSLQL